MFNDKITSFLKILLYTRDLKCWIYDQPKGKRPKITDRKINRVNQKKKDKNKKLKIKMLTLQMKVGLD